ncbi:MAG: hypothetical protein HKO74_06875 [Woeseiaceae bacterium]|nr:hypothetical protein [Woeseiaceae bacterium]
MEPREALSAPVATTAPAPKTPAAATPAALPKVTNEATAAIPVADPGRIKPLTKADVAGATAPLVHKPTFTADIDARIVACAGSRDPVIRHNYMVMLNAPIGQVEDPQKKQQIYVNSLTGSYDRAFESLAKAYVARRDALCAAGDIEKAYAEYVIYQDNSMQVLERMRREQAAKEKAEAERAERAETGARTANCESPAAGDEKTCCAKPMRCAALGFNLVVPNCDNPTRFREALCCKVPANRCHPYGFERPH